MSDKERLLLGGISALLPIILSLVQFDYQNTSQVIAATGWAGGLGFVFRVSLLFGLGAFFAYVHQDEQNRLKLLQLSVGAPALAMGLITGNIAATKAPPHPAPSGSVAPTVTGAHGASWQLSVFALVADVEAATQETSPQTDTERDIKTFTLQEQQVWSKIWHGFTGTPRRHVWFVIADTAPTAAEARQKAGAMNEQGGDVRAEVYRWSMDGQGYAVVVGRDLAFNDAQHLAAKLNSMTGTTKAHVWSPVQ